jgi:hypothetical protein
MDKCIKFSEYMGYLIDDEKQAEQGSKIVQAILEAQSPRLSQIAEKMEGKSSSCYKSIQRFLNKVDMKQTLLRFYQEEAEYVIGDPTEMVRYRAPKTSYVGRLSDGEASGYWLMVLSTAFRGRAIPFSFITYSSRTIGDQVTSRNQEHFRCFEAVKQLLGERPLVLDREFSYAELMEILYIEQLQFVIRLNQGDQHKQPRLIDAEGVPIKLFIRPGETVIHRQVYYLGTVKVNLIGYWRKSLSKPLWIITSLEPERGLELYFQRMKIEQSFRDCKDLLHLPKLMNKKQRYLEQMIALTLIAYTIGLWIGEAIRDVVYGGVPSNQVQESLLGKPAVDLVAQPKWRLYSGLFVLLKQKLRLSAHEMDILVAATASAFAHLVFGNVRSFV